MMKYMVNFDLNKFKSKGIIVELKESDSVDVKLQHVYDQIANSCNVAKNQVKNLQLKKTDDISKGVSDIIHVLQKGEKV